MTKVILSHRASLRPAWHTWDPVWKTKRAKLGLVPCFWHSHCFGFVVRQPVLAGQHSQANWLTSWAGTEEAEEGAGKRGESGRGRRKRERGTDSLTSSYPLKDTPQ